MVQIGEASEGPRGPFLLAHLNQRSKWTRRSKSGGGGGGGGGGWFGGGVGGGGVVSKSEMVLGEGVQIC